MHSKQELDLLRKRARKSVEDYDAYCQALQDNERAKNRIKAEMGYCAYHGEWDEYLSLQEVLEGLG